MTRNLALHGMVVLGHVAVASVGGMLATASLAVWLLGVVGARRAAWLTRGLLLGATSALAFGALQEGWAALQVVQAALLLLQLQRRLARGRGDERVSVVLAGLMLVSGAATGESVVFLGLALGWGLLLPAVLAPPGAGVPVAFWPPYGLFGALLFVALPRVASREPPEGRLTGFAPDVDLDDLQPLLEDPAVVFRAVVEPLPAEPIYWRGLALDGFDGLRWYSTTAPVPATLDGGHGPLVARVTPVVDLDGVLFVPGPPVRIDADAPLRADSQGGWFLASPGGLRPYVVEAAFPQAGGSPEAMADPRRFTRLPALPPALAELARQVGGEGTERERVDRWAEWLRREVRYTRAAGDHGDQPIADFLLHRREGHCAYVAAGLAVLARSQGIGARVVNGFVGGDTNPLTGEVVVRRQHAHSWTEVLLDGRWVLVDATPQGAVVPPASTGVADALESWWTGAVMPFDRGGQQALAFRVGAMVESVLQLRPTGLPWRGLLLVAGGAAVVGVAGRRAWQGWLRFDGTPPGGPVAREQARARRAVARAIALDAALPPVEAAEACRGRLPDEATDALIELAWLYYEVALGGEDPGARAEAARRLADRVEAALVGVTASR